VLTLGAANLGQYCEPGRVRLGRFGRKNRVDADPRRAWPS
jgi:hypothetical protein